MLNLCTSDECQPHLQVFLGIVSLSFMTSPRSPARCHVTGAGYYCPSSSGQPLPQSHWPHLGMAAVSPRLFHLRSINSSTRLHNSFCFCLPGPVVFLWVSRLPWASLGTIKQVLKLLQLIFQISMVKWGRKPLFPCKFLF